MNLKEKYARFKAWQQQPFSYEYKSHETQHCLNCDHDFTGNFCPYCSQKAGVGKVSWSSAKESVLEVWGVGNRSMTYSIWQLLWRPGYFVGDYISGRKQVSFPPVKMLLIVAVIVTLMEHLLGVESSEVTTDREYDFVALAAAWFQHNIGWGMLAANSLFLLPIWILFRFAPRHTRHTLPAGFFLQVFMSVLILVLNLISDFFTDWFAILVPLYYYVTCRQLFGYGRWATIWRLLIMAVVAIMTVVTIVLTLEYIVRRGLVLHQEIDAGEIASIICAIAVAVVLLLAGFLISWWRYKRKEKHLLSIKSIDYVRKDETTPRPDSERDS
jgi:hypothetical protein